LHTHATNHRNQRHTTTVLDSLIPPRPQLALLPRDDIIHALTDGNQRTPPGAILPNPHGLHVRHGPLIHQFLGHKRNTPEFLNAAPGSLRQRNGQESVRVQPPRVTLARSNLEACPDQRAAQPQTTLVDPRVEIIEQIIQGTPIPHPAHELLGPDIRLHQFPDIGVANPDIQMPRQ